MTGNRGLLIELPFSKSVVNERLNTFATLGLGCGLNGVRDVIVGIDTMSSMSNEAGTIVVTGFVRWDGDERGVNALVPFCNIDQLASEVFLIASADQPAYAKLLCEVLARWGLTQEDVSSLLKFDATPWFAGTSTDLRGYFMVGCILFLWAAFIRSCREAMTPPVAVSVAVLVN